MLMHQISDEQGENMQHKMWTLCLVWCFYAAGQAISAGI